MNNNYINFSKDDIISSIKQSFSYGSNLTKLIYINLGVFLIIKLVGIVISILNIDIMNPIVEYFSVPTNLSSLAMRPWSVLTYMFVHNGFIHILFNILCLHWFGTILLRYIDEKKFLSIYIIGGLTGASFYVFAYNMFPALSNIKDVSYAIGASASVMAVIIATCVYSPNYEMNLTLIGKVKIKYIALFFILLKILQMPSTSVGQNIIHLGGAFYGWLFISQLKKGKDISVGYNNMVNAIVNLCKQIAGLVFSKTKMKVSYKSTNKMSDTEYNVNKKVKTEQINDILEKISKSGYDSLNNKEKEILFKSSK